MPGRLNISKIGLGTRQIELATLPAYLDEFIHRPEVQQMLTSTSDLSRVKIRSVDPVTKQPRETVVDMSKVAAPLAPPAVFPPQLGTRTVSSPSQPEESSLWLRDGDVAEVPEK